MLIAPPNPVLSAAAGLGVLERNLAAMGGATRETARLIREARAREDLRLVVTDDPRTPSAMLEGGGDGGQSIALASRRRPMEEAQRLVAGVEAGAAAGVVVCGFGLGYHVAELARKLGRTGLVFVYEPDVSLLRWVLEHIDHSGWLGEANLAIFTDAEDVGGALTRTLRGHEAVPFLGTHLPMVDHPASRRRLGAGAGRFKACFASALRAVRTSIVTTMMQTDVSLRNQLMNLDRYVAGGGIEDLRGAAAGSPAIVVSAGPSLRRNVELLARPGVRERFVIVAAQTVLKTLLARGVRPHFVVALDYHEISRRFYEGLSESDVRGVTLVAEPQANPAILEAYPGEARCVPEQFLDLLLGHAAPRERFERGATVAHMAYALARWLGCDPVVLIGQDLGFTDGQYYGPGAAIHETWACELNAFNTLEMMEWQRVVRGRYRLGAGQPNLRRVKDALGRTIYTDEQMATYLAQFEAMFSADGQRGLSVIDATEGGVAKRHAPAARLADVMERFADAPAHGLPDGGEPKDRPGVVEETRRRLGAVMEDVSRVAELSRRTGSLLERMLGHHRDQALVNRLIGEVQEIGGRVHATRPAFDLVQMLNQTGAFKRVRADRQIELDQTLSPMERQRRQIERDVMNVRWVADAADQLGAMLRAAAGVLSGESPKVTRDPPPEGGAGLEGQVAPATVRRVLALIPVLDGGRGPGGAAALRERFVGDLPALASTLVRLGRARELDGIVILTDVARDVAALVARAGVQSVRVVECPGGEAGARLAAVASGRLWAPACWRGGLGSLTCYDEVLLPQIMARVMSELEIDAAALVGADWALIDPALVDAVVGRYRERPGEHRLTFSQAAPGLAPCVIDRGLMHDLADKAERAGAQASLGGILGYMPLAPGPDLIGNPNGRQVCIGVAPSVRDAGVRFVADTARRRAELARMAIEIGDEDASAERLAAVAAEHERGADAAGPRELLLEVCTGRRTSGPRGAWLRNSVEPLERPVMPEAVAAKLLADLGRARQDAVVSFCGAGDPMLHPGLLEMISKAKRAGIAGVHVRTDLACEAGALEALLESGADVISVDLMSETRETYRSLMGVDLFETVRGNLERLLRLREVRGGGIRTPWIVPRITRCDATLEEIEAFYDRWLLAAGAAVIDPLPGVLAGERIEPMPRPPSAARRMWRGRMLVLSDGTAPFGERDLAGDRIAGDAGRDGLVAVWRRVLRHRRGVAQEHGQGHADLWTGL